MRKIYYLFLLISLYLSVSAYAEISENQFQRLGQSEQIEILKQELETEIDFEEQVARLSVIANRKVQVKSLNKKGLYEQIKELFKEDEKSIKSNLVEKDLAHTILYLEDLKLAYKNTNVVKDQFLYYDALIDFQKRDYTKAQLKLEDLVSKYTSSNKYKAALFTLQNIYMKSSQNDKFLVAYEDYVWDKSASQEYWYGQALYNQNRYLDALVVFETLTGDDKFGFRAQFMLALISTFTESLETGLESFLLLMQAHPINTPYYEYLPLNIARIQAQLGNIESATRFYSQYNNMVSESGSMTTDVKFEIAVMSMNAGDIEMAKALLEDIQANPYANEYYTACVYLLATMDYDKTSLAEQQAVVSSAVDFANLYLDILTKKHKKVQELQNLRIKLFSADSKKEKLDLVTKIQSAEDKISLASESLLKYASGADEEKLRKLWGMENNYIDTINGSVEEVLRLHLLSEQPNDARVAMVDDILIDTDLLYIFSLAKKFLLDMENVSSNDLNTALSVAKEIYDSKKMIQVWDNVKELLETQDNLAKIEKIEEHVFNLKKSTANLENEMELRFGDYWEDEELAEALQSNLEDMLEERQHYLEMRKFISESFNERLAAALLRRAEKDIAAQDKVIDEHTTTVADIRGDILKVKTEFDYTIIDLLYIDVIKEDKAFIRARDRDVFPTTGGK